LPQKLFSYLRLDGVHRRHMQERAGRARALEVSGPDGYDPLAGEPSAPGRAERPDLAVPELEHGLQTKPSRT
jgi:hypothetical protein